MEAASDVRERAVGMERSDSHAAVWTAEGQAGVSWLNECLERRFGGIDQSEGSHPPGLGFE